MPAEGRRTWFSHDESPGSARSLCDSESRFHADRVAGVRGDHRDSGVAAPPFLPDAKAKSQAITCLNNLRQLSLATQVYTDDYRDLLPYNLGHAEIVRTVARNWYYNWSTPIMSWELDSDNTNTTLLVKGGIGPYTGPSTRLYRCPSDTVLSEVQAQRGWRERIRRRFHEPDDWQRGDYLRG